MRISKFCVLIGLLLQASVISQVVPGMVDTISPTVRVNYPSGTYTSLLRVEFETSEPATVFYTTNNSPPTEKSQAYSGLVTLSTEGKTVLRYIAIDMVGNRSPEYSQAYEIDTRSPAVSVFPPGGKFSSLVKVTIQTNEPSRIFYAIDPLGRIDTTVPGLGIQKNVSISQSCTLRVVVRDAAGNTSDKASFAFSIDRDLPVVTTDKQAGVYNTPIPVTLSSDSGVNIFYSFDEFAPLSSFQAYTGPIKLRPGQTVLSYYGRKEVGTRSPVQKTVYIVDIYPPKVTTLVKESKGRRDVTLRSSEKASLLYTLDGSQPTEQSIPYTGPITISPRGVTVLRVFAKDGAGNVSDDFYQKFSYDKIPPKVSFDPKPGLYNRPVQIKIEANEPVTIFYTLDNTMPTANSAEYSAPILLAKDGATVVTFYAMDEADNKTELYSLTYSIDQTPPKVSVKIERDTSNKIFTVTLSAGKGERIYYTLDGSTPTFTSFPCTGPFTVNTGQAVKYIAIDEAGNMTPVREITEIATPRVSARPAGGIFNRPLRIELKANRLGKVFYRINTKTVQRGDFLDYTEPVSLKTNGLFKLEYFSEDSLLNRSTINEETYFIDLIAPEIKIYTQRSQADTTIAVFFQASENVTVYYTIDGSNPTVSPTAKVVCNKYFLSKDKILLKPTENMQLSFVGEDIAGNKSEMYQFDINLPTVIPNYPGGSYNEILNVTLTTFNEAAVYYTLDGSSPTEHAEIYRKPIPVTRNTTLKYFAIDKYGYRSPVREVVYAIDLPPRPDFRVEADTLIEGMVVQLNADVSVDEESPREALQYRWDFDSDSAWDTKLSAAVKVLHVFKTPGVHLVSLMVQDNAGLTATTTKRVQVIKDCPKDMVSLFDDRRAYCIDRYEYPNTKGTEPLAGVSWVEAVMRCRSAGKTLCSRSQWQQACRGGAGAAYPYGPTYDKKKCNSEGSGFTRSGEYNDCSNGNGVYDLTGNAWEWLLDRNEGYNTIAGGNYYYGKNADCGATFPNLLSAKAGDIGFRCCK